MKAFRKWNLVVYSYFEKGCGKNGIRTRQSRNILWQKRMGWFWVFCSSNKFERMALEAIDVRLRVLKESSNRGFDSYSVRNSVLIISHITFRDCRVHIFSYNLSRNSCMLVSISTMRYTRPSWGSVQSLYEEGSTVIQRGRDTSVRSKERYKTIKTNESMDSLKNKGRQTTGITTENLMSQAGKGRIISRRP